MEVVYVVCIGGLLCVELCVVLLKPGNKHQVHPMTNVNRTLQAGIEREVEVVAIVVVVEDEKETGCG